jgi:hypothetical protein
MCMMYVYDVCVCVYVLTLFLQGTPSPVNPLAYGIIDLTNHITSRHNIHIGKLKWFAHDMV